MSKRKAKPQQPRSKFEWDLRDVSEGGDIIIEKSDGLCSSCRHTCRMAERVDHCERYERRVTR